ncbi:putative protein kinase [Plasmopara halstedii]
MRLILCVIYLLQCCKVCDAESDIVARLYALENAGVSVAKLPLQSNALPNAISKRLLSYSLTWNDLSGLMQRALLWDTGFVFASSLSSVSTDVQDHLKLVQIFTSCSQGMNDILPSVAEIRILQSAGPSPSCQVETCGSIGHFLSPLCPVEIVLPLTRCAIYTSDMDGQDQVSGVYYAQDGRSPSIPNPIIRRHTSIHTNVNQSLFAIHLSDISFLGLKSCEPYTNFIVPCRGIENSNLPFENTTITNDIILCPATYGVTMTLWLQLTSMPSFAPFSTSAIVSLTIMTFFCVILLVYICYCTQSRTWVQKSYENVRLDDKWDDQTQSHSSNILRRFFTRRTKRKTHNHLTSIENLQQYTRELPEGTTHVEVTEFNHEICQQSVILSTFVSDPTIITKRIAFSHLHRLRLLAKGGSGEVWLGQYETQYVAMKCLLSLKRKDFQALEQFAEEIRMASLLEHPRIVTFFGVAWHSLWHLCAITEYMAYGDLETVLTHSNSRNEFSWKREKFQIACDIIEALVYLHSLLPIVIHRDLKSKNVLLDRYLHAKLSDFGLSQGKRYDETSDLWSFGVVLSEIDTCALPYGFTRHTKMQSIQIVHFVSKGQLLPTFQDDCPKEIRELAFRCLNLDPKARPTALTVAYELRSIIAPLILSLD